MSGNISLKIVIVVLLAVAITTSTSLTITTASTYSQYYQPTIAPQQYYNTTMQQYCGYPFNPWVCNEGPPITIVGYLTVDSSCVFLYTASGINYVVWHLPKRDRTMYQNQGVEVYGFIYPDWPTDQPFPSNPFQQNICVGVPMWAIPPYIQAFS